MVTAIHMRQNATQLTCEASGLYPEPSVMWTMDSDQSPESNTVIWPNPILYSVSSTVTRDDAVNVTTCAIVSGGRWMDFSVTTGTKTK